MSVLTQFADKKYLDFNKRLVKSTYPMLGVRIPKIREVAKQIIKQKQEESVLASSPVYYEEVILRGIILSYNPNVLDSFASFLPYIDNWQTCDTVILSFKKIKCVKKEFLQRFEVLAKGSEWERRALVVALIGYFLDDEYIDKALTIATQADNDEYYVSMAVAWFFATAMINYSQKVIQLLQSGAVKKATVYRTVRKAIESYRISHDLKTIIRGMEIYDNTKQN